MVLYTAVVMMNMGGPSTVSYALLCVLLDDADEVVTNRFLKSTASCLGCFTITTLSPFLFNHTSPLRLLDEELPKSKPSTQPSVEAPQFSDGPERKEPRCVNSWTR
jgi:hypothetical protein